MSCKHGVTRFCRICFEQEQDSAAVTDVPNVHIEDIASSYQEFYEKLLTGDLPPLPFWLKIGDTGFKLTRDNFREVSLGMHLSIEVRCFFPR